MLRAIDTMMPYAAAAAAASAMIVNGFTVRYRLRVNGAIYCLHIYEGDNGIRRYANTIAMRQRQRHTVLSREMLLKARWRSASAFYALLRS